MKNLLTLLAAICISINGFAQTDQNLWDNLKTVSTKDYEIQVPTSWKRIRASSQGFELYYEANGFGLPKSYNSYPVILTVFMTKQVCKNLENCKEIVMDGYRGNQDRKFQNKIKDREEKTKLTSGQDAYFLSTRFLKKSNQSNQSRYDMVVYSDIEKIGYVYTVSVQYADADYSFESDNNLKGFAEKVFSYLRINPLPRDISTTAK
ncbi:MAG: hypothetical protein NTX03_02050 [Bacteroidetes bacterium]|nr:hypothetical protein [Bacteroidota bacterium]